MPRIIQIMPKTITNSFLALLLAWLSLAPAYAAAPPACYPNTPLAELRLENSPLADHAEGDLRLDFDGDGKTDVFSTEPEDGQYRWRFSAGARQPWQNLGRSVVAPANLRFGDFNGDGKTDLFSIGPNHQWRYAAAGVTVWAPLFQDLDQKTPLAELRFGDFDGDGKTDVFRIGPDERWLYSSGAAAAWQKLNPLDMETPLAGLRFGDFDGDGKTDVFRIGIDGRWQYSPAGAAWQKLNPLNMETPLAELRFGDFDGDGQTDAFRRKASGQWQYSPGAAGDWQDLARLDVGLAGLRFGDFDGDGVTDVLSEAPGGKWRVSLGGTAAWRIIFATVEVEGGRLTCLTGDSGFGLFSSFPAISADGSKIVFVSNANLNNEGDIGGGRSEIWLYNVADGELTRLTSSSGPDRSSRFPAISADGSRIIFESDSDFNNEGDIGARQYEIWLYDLNAQPGQQLTRITTASGSDRASFSPAIGADGSRVVFISDSDFNNEGDIGARQYEIWLHNVDGPDGNLTRLTPASGPGRENDLPAINADGSKTVFVSNADFNSEGLPADQFEIWLYDAPSSNFTRLTDTRSDIYSDELAINADGSKIVFQSDSDFNNEDDIGGGQFEIWLYDLDAQSGQKFIRITNSGPDRDNFIPAINPDGNKIVFHSNADFKGEGIPVDQHEIWLYNVDAPPGQELTRLTNSGSGRKSRFSTINADGSKIVFESDADFLGLGTPPGLFEIWLFEADPTPPRPDPTPTPNPTPVPQPNPEGGITVYLPLVVK